MRKFTKKYFCFFMVILTLQLIIPFVTVNSADISGDEDEAIFDEYFAASVPSFNPGLEPVLVDTYPAWSFSSPSMSLSQQCSVKVEGGYLLFTKLTTPPSPASYTNTLEARRSFNPNSLKTANLTGRYRLEFTVSSQSSTIEGMYFRVQSHDGVTLIDGFVNNSKQVVELTRGDGTAGRQTYNSLPVSMPTTSIFSSDTTLAFEIDTKKGSFKYYQSNINSGKTPVPGINGNTDRLFEVSDESQFNLGSIYFAPRNNVPKGHIWRIKNIKLTRFSNTKIFEIGKTIYYKNSVNQENIIPEIKGGENLQNIIAVTDVKNATDFPQRFSSVMAYYGTEDMVKNTSNFIDVTVPPNETYNAQLSIQDVNFIDEKDILKTFFWNGFEKMQPLNKVKKLEIGYRDDMSIVLQRLQQGIFSSSADPISLINQEWAGNGRFTTINYSDTTTMTNFGPSRALDKIKIMVQAYMSKGNQYYQNEALKEKIDLALGDWAANDYKSVNWWYNQIDVPQKMVNILLYNLPNASYTNKLYEITRRGLPTINSSLPHGSTDVGANLTDKLLTTIKICAATNDAEAMKKYVTNLLDGELKIFASPIEGIMSDFSFQQHGALLYNGSYGAVFVNGVNNLLNNLKYTQFMVSDRAINVYADFILDGQQYMFRNNTYDFGVSGRAISRENAIGSGVKNGVLNAVNILLSLEETMRRDELQHLKNMRLGGTDNQTDFAKHFFTSDFTVVHRPNYYVSVRGTSTRNKKTEYMNGENSKGYFLADGTTVIMKDGTEYNNIYPVWDWNKIPGTTSVQVETIPKPASEIGGGTFVGGLSDGRFAISAIDLINTKTTTKLNAKKSYFLFDEGFIALGSGITTTLNSEVITSINQTLLLGKDILYNDGEIRTIKASAGDTANVSNVSWVLHNDIGYILNEPKMVTISKKTQKGKWTAINSGQSNSSEISKDVFGIYLSHSMKPADASYSYMVLPKATMQEVEQYAKNPNMVEISNTAQNASVWNNAEQALGIVFWAAGSVNVNSKKVTGLDDDLSVSADKPCIIFIKKENNLWKIMASNPNNAALSLNITVNRNLRGIGASSIEGGTNVIIDLPGGLYAGSTVKVELEE